MSVRRSFAVGEEVRITGGLFAGQTGRIEEVLPSGKLQVRVETSRTGARARVHPAHATALMGSDALGEPSAGTLGPQETDVPPGSSDR